MRRIVISVYNIIGGFLVFIGLVVVTVAFALLECLLTLRCDAEKSQESFNEVRKPYQESCNEDDMEGCIKLGVIEEKQGNINKARGLYQKACDKNNMEGCHNLSKVLKK